MTNTPLGLAPPSMIQPYGVMLAWPGLVENYLSAAAISSTIYKGQLHQEDSNQVVATICERNYGAFKYLY